MRKRSARIRALVLATVVAALVAGVAVGTTSAGAARSVRGFDAARNDQQRFGHQKYSPPFTFSVCAVI